MPGHMGVMAKPFATPPATDPYGVSWHSAVWAEDPDWLSIPADGGAVSSIRNAGTFRDATTTTFTDGTLGLYVPFGPIPGGVHLSRGGRVDHAAAMNVTDIDFRCRIKMDDWTPVDVARGVVEKRISNNTTADLSWEFAIRTDGSLQTIWMQGDGTQIDAYSGSAVTASNGDSLWLRTTVDMDDGAGHYVVKFYQGADGASEPGSWTQVGSTVTGGSTSNVRTNTSPFSFGTAGIAGNAAGIGGYLRRAILYTNLTATTAVYDVDFQRANTAAFTEDGPNGYTVRVESLCDPVQFTAANQPAYRATAAAALNSKPTIQGDGVNDYLGMNSGPYRLAQPYTVVVIESGSASGKAPVDVRLSSTGWSFYRNGSDYWSYAGSVLATSGGADNGGHLMRFLANGASSKIAENETVLVTGNAGTGGADQLSICGSELNFNTSAYIAFVGLFSGDVTADPEWASFKAWAASHYGITIA